MTSRYYNVERTGNRPLSTPAISSAYSVPVKQTEASNASNLDGLTIDGGNLDFDFTPTPVISPGVSARVPGPCAECGQRINNIGDACHAMGYLYHNSCFVCCLCQRTLRGKRFYQDQDRIYCEEDYLYCGFQQETEKCSACGHLISETVLKALGKAYHPSCFTCSICFKCLDGVPFTVDAKNAIYCIPDYYLVHSPRCAACGLAIIPSNNSNETVRISAMNKDFHLECYYCADCKKTLGDEVDNRCYPISESDPLQPDRVIQRLLCLNCHLSRIGAVPATVPSSMQTSLRPINSSANQQIRYYPVSLKLPFGQNK